MTSAALVMRSFDTPEAIRPRVPIEQGIMIIVSYLPDPEAKGEKNLALHKKLSVTLIIFITSSVFQTSSAFSVITTANSSH
jgi:hypothetical protein